MPTAHSDVALLLGCLVMTYRHAVMCRCGLTFWVPMFVIKLLCGADLFIFINVI